MKNIKRMISGWVTGALFLGLLSACEQEKTLSRKPECIFMDRRRVNTVS